MIFDKEVLFFYVKWQKKKEKKKKKNRSSTDSSDSDSDDYSKRSKVNHVKLYIKDC